VTWSAPASDGGANITGYDLRRIRSDAPDKADANWTVEQDVRSSGDELRHTLGGLDNGVEYDVQVRAVNAAGKGPWSQTGKGAPRAVAGTPGIDSVTPGDAMLTAAWSAPAETGGSPVTGYDLRHIRNDAPDKADANWTVEQDVRSSGDELRHTRRCWEFRQPGTHRERPDQRRGV
jgi:hypothetical protein